MGNLYGTLDTLAIHMLLANPFGALRKGIVVALGNGALTRGTVLVKNATTGLFEPATADTLIAGSIACVLAEDVATGAVAAGAAPAVSGYFRGEFLKGKVKLATGALPAAAYGVLNGMGIFMQEYVPAEGAETVLANDTVATPVATPGAGEVAPGTEVALACATTGAKIYYTTDGSAPTAESTEYTAPIAVSTPVTIKAIAVKTGKINSAVLSAAYTIATAATPTADPAAGEVESGTEVTLATATTGATIYYTTDGSAPTASSTEYTEPIALTEAKTIKAIAVKAGMNNSAVLTAAYTIAAG